HVPRAGARPVVPTAGVRRNRRVAEIALAESGCVWRGRNPETRVGTSAVPRIIAHGPIATSVIRDRCRGPTAAILLHQVAVVPTTGCGNAGAIEAAHPSILRNGTRWTLALGAAGGRGAQPVDGQVEVELGVKLRLIDIGEQPQELTAVRTAPGNALPLLSPVDRIGPRERTTNRKALVGIVVALDAKAELLQIVGAGASARRFASRLDCRKQ